jgi:hypothetical protein
MEIREALEAAVTEHEDPVDDTPAVEVVPDSVEASPPDSGAEGETPEKAESPDTPIEKAEAPAKEAAPAPKAETPEQRAAHRVDRAPASWKKEAKGEWAALPLHVRQEVYRREMEVDRVLKEAAPVREQLNQFQQTIAPYMARVQAFGVTPVQAMQELFKADHILATSSKEQRAAHMAKLIADYDVDVVALDAAIVARRQGQQQAQPQGFDPNYVNQLVQQKLNQALAPIFQERQQAEQAQQAQVTQTVEQMSLDPKYPYFDDVREEMADLIEVAAKRGRALSLDEAYHTAVSLNPNAVEQQSRQAQISQANAQHQQAQRAKVAASSINGAPAAGGSQQFSGDGSLRGAIEAAFAGNRV